MTKKILIAYATNYGSTREVANFIAEVMRHKTFIVEVDDIEEIHNLQGYDGVIIGTAIRMERPLSVTVKFVKKYTDQLKSLPVACFALGATLQEESNFNRAKMMNFMNPLVKEIGDPLTVGLFGGKLDYSQLSWIWKNIASKDDSGLLKEGDWRNWNTIKNWAEEVCDKFTNSNED